MTQRLAGERAPEFAADKPAVVICYASRRGYADWSRLKPVLTSNLSELEKRDISVLLTGMLAPPNLGRSMVSSAYFRHWRETQCRVPIVFLTESPVNLSNRMVFTQTAGVDEIVQRILPKAATIKRVRP